MNFENLTSTMNQKIPQNQEITLDTITFEWVEGSSSVKDLKKALRVLEKDGNHFKDLKLEIVRKINKLEAKNKNPLKTPERLTEEREKAVKELSDWVMVDSPTKEEEKKKQQSEEEKNKGNDALRSGDIEEAILHYSRAVQIDKGRVSERSN